MRKKCLTLILALVLLMSVCVVPALADGFYDIGTVAGVTVIPQDAAGNDVTETDGGDPAVYPDTVKLDVTVAGATVGAQYLVVLAEADDVTGITKDSLLYVDQVEATGSEINFSVYPILREGNLTLFVIGDDDTALTVPVSYYQDKASYTLGDIYGKDGGPDGKINGIDLTYLAQYLAKMVTLDDTQILAADVYGKDGGPDGKVNGLDLTRLAQFLAKMFPEL